MPIVGIQYLFIHESGLCGKIQTKAYKYIYIHTYLLSIGRPTDFIKRGGGYGTCPEL